jgi:flagellar hook-associated protein 1 FlgK
MSLTQALATAVAGLRASQAGMTVVAANVANAETPGYIRKVPVQIETSAGDLGVSVRVSAIRRELDLYVQRQLRVETSGAGYAELRARFYDRLQHVYGVPGSDITLESIFNQFTTALQAVSTTPDSASTRSAVISAAQVLAQQLNGMTADIQGLRTDAELGIADAVATANDAMQQIVRINQQLATSDRDDASTAALLDQRDNYIDLLSQLMDVRVIPNDHNQVTVFTNSGVELVGTRASQLAFDPQGTMTPAAQWSEDPTLRAVGTIVLHGANGGDVDLIATNAIRSGTIAAYLDMRDRVLVQAQDQLDEFAAQLAQALSNRTIAATAATAGAQSGFDIDIASLSAGNVIHLTYTDSSSVTHKLTLMRVDDPAALPLPDSATSDPADQVTGLDFSGGMAAVVAQLNSALGGTGMQFSNPSGTTLRVLDDGAANNVEVDALSATFTVTALADGGVEFPFFLDANFPYTGALTATGSQHTGIAGRIAVNAALVADPSRLVVYATSPLTPAGDAARPNFIYDRMVNSGLTFSPQSGIGTTTSPFTGSLAAYLRQVVSVQGQAAEAAANLRDGQDVVLNSLRERFNDVSGVNIDEEMANLLNLQTAYAANARVLTTIRAMFDELMSI